jgi:hypothetical protein
MYSLLVIALLFFLSECHGNSSSETTSGGPVSLLLVVPGEARARAKVSQSVVTLTGPFSSFSVGCCRLSVIMWICE